MVMRVTLNLGYKNALAGICGKGVMVLGDLERSHRWSNEIQNRRRLSWVGSKQSEQGKEGTMVILVITGFKRCLKFTKSPYTYS